MYCTPPLVTICKLQKPGKFKTHFFGALVPCLTSEVRRGTCRLPCQKKRYFDEYTIFSTRKEALHYFFFSIKRYPIDPCNLYCIDRINRDKKWTIFRFYHLPRYLQNLHVFASNNKYDKVFAFNMIQFAQKSQAWTYSKMLTSWGNLK